MSSNEERKPAWRRGGVLLAASVVATVALIALGVIVLTGTQGEGEAESSAGYPESKLTVAEATEPLEGAPKPLADLRADANQILGGGQEAFDARLEELRGFPVVINKWASWCVPCIEEFPMFQQVAMARGRHVAFLGLNFQDPLDAAETFLQRLPVPYPSYEDARGKLSRSVDADFGAPNTVFLDKDGKVVHTKYGPYQTADELYDDVARYAL